MTLARTKPFGHGAPGALGPPGLGLGPLGLGTPGLGPLGPLGLGPLGPLGLGPLGLGAPPAPFIGMMTIVGSRKRSENQFI